jgi:hypothetical protein
MKREMLKQGISAAVVILGLTAVNAFSQESGYSAAPGGSGAPVPAAEEEKPTASAEVAFLSQYIWRGFELSKDSLVIEPSLTVGYKGFSMNVWGNLDTSYAGNENEDSKWNETDFTVSYDTELGPFAVGVGYIYYALDSVNDSQEFYGSVGWNVFLSPTFTVYKEIAHMPAWYMTFGLSHSIELPRGMSLELAGTVSYYYSEDNDFVEYNDDLEPTTTKYRDFHNGLISASLTIPFGKYFAVTPTVAYSFPLSDQAENLIKATSFSDKSDFVYGGATFSISF